MVPSINHMPIYNCSEFTNQYQNHDYNTTPHSANLTASFDVTRQPNTEPTDIQEK